MKNWIATLLGLLWAATAFAQADFPSRPVRIIVPFAAGSTADITARAVGQVLARGLGQPVIVDNRPGAGGTLGMAAAARSPADGYTLVMATVATTAIAAATMKNPGFDIARDFAPVSLVANTTLILLVGQDAGVKSLPELLALGKRSPGQVTYGNVSTMYQLAMELLNRQAGTDFRAIPYRGPQEAAVDLLGGRLTLLPDTVSSALRSIESGKARPVAILSSRRSPVLPDVPTVQEQGFHDFAFDGWNGLLAPAGTPPAILQRLNQEVAKAIATEEIHAQFRKLSLVPTASTMQEYGEVITRDVARYAKLAEGAGIPKH